ncbi:MAG: hypothetical protein EBV34_21270, partial [Betaproteobacteria bacterium]|nr:hypothetical protein [Betaproteobacteria bacterium]
GMRTGLIDAASLRLARVAMCFSFPILFKHRQVCFRLLRMGNRCPSDLAGHWGIDCVSQTIRKIDQVMI